MVMKKYNIKSFIVRVEIYKTEVLVNVGDFTGLKKKLKKYLSKQEITQFTEDLNEHSSGRSMPIKSKRCFCIWVKEYPDTVDAIAVMSHEILHIVFMIMAEVGIEYSQESEEAYTYLMQFLTEAIYEKLISSST